MKNRDVYWKRYKIQETLYLGKWRLSPLQSRHLGTSHSSPNCHWLPVVFSWISLIVWNLFPFKGDFSFWKSKKSQGSKFGLLVGMSLLGDLMFHQKTPHETRCMSGALPWWSCQSPVAHSCCLLNHPNSFPGGMFKLNAKFDADSLFYLLSHFECDSHTVHMLTQWHLPPPLTSTVKLSLFTHAHSSPLSLAARLHWYHTNCSYVNNGWNFSRQTL